MNRKTRLGYALAAAAFVIVAIPVGVLVNDLLSDRQEEQDLHARMSGSLRRVAFRSRILKANKDMLVYLPPGYDDPENAEVRYPAVYLLHGCPGQARDWVVKGSANVTLEKMILADSVAPMILVCPDLQGPRGQFDCNGAMDRPDGSWSVERYLLDEVVNRVDANYRTKADAGHRAVAGVSMGGFAAANLAVRHPEVFSVACAMSGYFRAADFTPIARHVLGGRMDLWRANSPQDTIVTVHDPASLHVLLICGAHDQYVRQNRAFAARLQELGADSDLRISTGAHGFAFWSRRLRDCLLFADRRFRAHP
ncbi:MAG TPA: alpha/beta hydrolase-fold protein [Armatimonadota bacterium]